MSAGTYCVPTLPDSCFHAVEHVPVEHVPVDAWVVENGGLWVVRSVTEQQPGAWRVILAALDPVEEGGGDRPRVVVGYRPLARMELAIHAAPGDTLLVEVTDVADPEPEPVLRRGARP